MTTTLEDLMADISSVARRPSEAKQVVAPPVIPEIEVSELDVVEEVVERPPRLARGTEPASSEDGRKEVGLIDLEPMRSAEYAEMAIAAPSGRKQRRRRNAIGALMLLVGAGLGVGAMAAWPMVAERFGGSSERDQIAELEAASARLAAAERDLAVASATPAPAPQPAQTEAEQEEFVAIDELEPAEPGDIEIDFPVMAIKPRAALVADADRPEAPTAPPAALSLEAPCYEAACATVDEATDDEGDQTAGEADDAEDQGEADDESGEADETAAAPAPPPVDPRTLPAHPHPSAIANAVVAVQDQLDGCGDAFGMHGAVRVKLHVTPAGVVDAATVLDGSAGFRTCVSDAARRVRLPASNLGATETLAIRIH